MSINRRCDDLKQGALSLDIDNDIHLHKCLDVIYLYRRKELNVRQLAEEGRIEYMEYVIGGVALSVVAFAIQFTSYKSGKR